MKMIIKTKREKNHTTQIFTENSPDDDADASSDVDLDLPALSTSTGATSAAGAEECGGVPPRWGQVRNP